MGLVDTLIEGLRLISDTRLIANITERRLAGEKFARGFALFRIWVQN
jgi:hypothetical protein